jgi:hypothetical protein
MGSIVRSIGCRVLHRPVELAPFVGSYGSVPSCDVEDGAIRETFCGLRTEIRKAPGSSEVCKPGARGVEAEEGPE